MGEILCFDSKGTGASGRGTLITLVMVWRRLSADGKFLMSNFFLFALFILKNNPQALNACYQNKNMLSNMDGLNFNTNIIISNGKS